MLRFAPACPHSDAQLAVEHCPLASTFCVAQHGQDDLGPYLPTPRRAVSCSHRNPGRSETWRSVGPEDGRMGCSWNARAPPVAQRPRPALPALSRAPRRGICTSNQIGHARAGCTRRTGRRKRALVYVHGWLRARLVARSALLPAALRRPRRRRAPPSAPALPRDVRNPRSAPSPGEFFWTADLVRSIEAVRQASPPTRERSCSHALSAPRDTPRSASPASAWEHRWRWSSRASTHLLQLHRPDHRASPARRGRRRRPHFLANESRPRTVRDQSSAAARRVCASPRLW